MMYAALVSLGMQPDATIEGSVASVAIVPPATRLATQLAERLWSAGNCDLRTVRDAVLSLTDWTQAADSPLSQEQRQAWAAYRQALRDLPSAWDGQGPVPWPDPPAG